MKALRLHGVQYCHNAWEFKNMYCISCNKYFFHRQGHSNICVSGIHRPKYYHYSSYAGETIIFNTFFVFLSVTDFSICLSLFSTSILDHILYTFFSKNFLICNWVIWRHMVFTLTCRTITVASVGLMLLLSQVGIVQCTIYNFV